MKKVKPAAAVILAALIFTIIIPIAINESYKRGVVYITKWDAADALSYYGTLLGAVTTVTVLAITISFTKKQIRHGQFLDHNYAKWEQIESTITKILLDISPLAINDFREIDTSNNKISTAMLLAMQIHLQNYETTIKTSLDAMRCHINPHDYPQMAAFEKQLTDCITQFCEIEEKLKAEIWKLAVDASANQGTVSFPVLYFFYNEVTGIVNMISTAHDGPYQELLNKKREVFEQIYADIERQAEEILQFKKRRRARHAHT